MRYQTGLLVLAASLAGCTVPPSVPPPAAQTATYGGFNTTPLVDPQTPGTSAQNAGPNVPLVPPNSLPSGGGAPVRY